jgi:ketosteroid isomerase-like protein
MNAFLVGWSRVMLLGAVLTLGACQGRDPELLTAGERAATAKAVEAVWVEMMAAGRARNPDGIRAAYVERPVVAINGRIVDDFDRDQFDEVRLWLRSLQQFEASYDHVHLEVLGPTATVATMNHHLRWTDSSGTSGEWNSVWTAVFRRIDGRWRITYSHESTPPPGG